MPSGKITELDTSVSPHTVAVDIGGGDTVECELMRGASVPMIGDTAVVDVLEDDDATAIATLPDTEAAAGEFKAYARDPGGAITGTVWIKADGSVTVTTPKCELLIDADGNALVSNAKCSLELLDSGEAKITTPVASVEIPKAGGSLLLKNAAASAEMKPTGEIAFGNGATITPIGDIVTASGISTMLHTHISAAPGAPSGPPLPAP